MITRERQIQLALAILKPTDREKCRADIVLILDVVDIQIAFEQNEAFLSSRSGRLKVQALQRALKQVRIAYEALPETVKDEVFGDIDLQKQLVACDTVLKPPSKKRRLGQAYRQRLAVAGSQSLLLDYNIPETVTRKGPWHQLAAIVYGDRKADLFPYLRQSKGALD